MRLLWAYIMAAACLCFPPSLYSDSVKLVWDENSEKDLAGYRLYLGKAPGRYIKAIDVGERTQYRIDSLQVGEKYYFAVTAVDYWGNESHYSNEVSTWIGDEPPLPGRLHLGANYPNPFNPGTFFRVELPQSEKIKVTVVNALGQTLKILAEGSHDAGYHTLHWDGTSHGGTPVPAGPYFILLEAGSEIRIRPVTLLR